MKPVDQKFLRNTEDGVRGDCQRACIASLLEVAIDAVPHFGEAPGADDKFIFEREINKFLLSRGHFHIIIGYQSFMDAVDFFGLSGVYHLMYGKTGRDSYHAVVGLDGKMVHDPHPDRRGLIECETVGLICSACNDFQYFMSGIKRCPVDGPRG